MCKNHVKNMQKTYKKHATYLQNSHKNYAKLTQKHTKLAQKRVLKKPLATILYSPSLPLRQNLKKMMHIGISVAFGVSPL